MLCMLRVPCPAYLDTIAGAMESARQRHVRFHKQVAQKQAIVLIFALAAAAVYSWRRKQRTVTKNFKRV